MYPRFKSRSFLSPLVIAIVAVLAILAILQYRWSAQVAAANEAQIGANLQALLLDWHMDLFREFSGIAIALQVGPDSGAHDDWPDYGERYAEWRSSDPHPGVIENIFIWETGERGERELLRFDLENRRMEEQKPPEHLVALLDRLASRASSLKLAMRAWKADGLPGTVPESAVPGARPDAMTGWQFDPVVPALVHPLVHHVHRNDPEEGSSPNAVDWIVVVFSPEYLQNRLFPDLTARYFETSGHLEYKLAVASGGKSPRVLYSSDSDYGYKNAPSADIVMNIFGPPPDSTEGHLWQTVKNAAALQPRQWHRFAGPTWFPVIQYGGPGPNGDAAWQLILSSRQGALQNVIASGQRRNLLVSYGVLLLLALSMGLVVLASHRAQKLATLQMDFMASVSHELRTPLTVIASAADNMADKVVGNDEQVTKYGSVIRAQARQLANLVEQILQFAAAREGKTQYVIRSISVRDLIDTAIANTRGFMEVAGFTLEQQIDPDLPPISGDLAGLALCLQNLIVNAIKYGGDPRWLRIEARSTGTVGNGKQIQITVRDRGMGIPASELPHIFEPFYRGASARDAQIHGTGLGLPLAQSIAQSMGGELTVSSEPEHGSAFTLHLPTTQDDSLASVTDSSSSVVKHSR